MRASINRGNTFLTLKLLCIFLCLCSLVTRGTPHSFVPDHRHGLAGKHWISNAGNAGLAMQFSPVFVDECGWVM
ncbi:hypothetical protein HHUSO_G18506 [Huso huso]|uniref:Uncharacterized protein n=1 Tax=Huso huso TaxID=61971 RepID=A0ABR0Z7E7_HUSHU